MTLELTYLSHSAFQFVVQESQILIDPFFSGNPKFNGNISEFKPTEIFVTHGHADHLGDAINLSKRTGAPIIAVFELANYCASKGANVNPVGIGAKLSFDWGYATFLPAAHSSSTPDGNYAGCAASIMFRFKDTKIYHAGDTGFSADLKMIGDLYKPEVSLIPIGGQYTLDIQEAIVAAKMLSTKQVIPMHYNTFPQISVDIESFKLHMQSESMIKPVVLNPGEKVTYKL